MHDGGGKAERRERKTIRKSKGRRQKREGKEGLCNRDGSMESKKKERQLG